MTSLHSDIEKGCVEFEHGLSSSQEKMASENSDLNTTLLSTFEELLSAANPPFQEEESIIIFKVPHRLREVNEKAYEPNVISIGPYHYHKPHLARMEDIKKRWFEKLVEESHLGLRQFREAMKHLEGKTRKCYEQPLPPDLEDEPNFVDMMVYDGCFVVQLIRKGNLDGFSELGRQVVNGMLNDLLLLENQLPFFVLLELYSMINPDHEPGGHFNDLASSALEFFDRDTRSLPENTTSIRHLLHLVHTTFHPSPPQIRAEVAKKVAYCFPKKTSIKNLLHWVHTTFLPSLPGSQAGEAKREENCQSLQNSMRSATELEDAGIHFSHLPIQNIQTQKQGKENMFDITFDNDTKELKIPTLEVNDFTESEFRNYMAYEQFFPLEEPTYFVDYVIFMDGLINTGKDVELLRKSGIIRNLLGNDEAVTQIFNKLGDFIVYTPEGFYKDISNQVNKHCKKKWNTWKAKLKKEYFNTPWSPISFLAALVLLLLTILQTIFSLLSYYHGRQ